MAAKQTSSLIPLCHPLPLTHVSVELTPARRGYTIEARVRTSAQTGVEMEALTAVSVAALTIYDMVKAVDKAMVIGDIRLVKKTGENPGRTSGAAARTACRSSSPSTIASLPGRFPRHTSTSSGGGFRTSLSSLPRSRLGPGAGAEADVAFALGLSKEAAARATRLRWVHCSAHAVGQFPLADLASRGVTVTNSRGIQSTPIAEHVMAGLLALARRLPQTLRRQEQRVWLPNELTGQASPWLIAGKTMGIIGLGTLGRRLPRVQRPSECA